MTPPAKPTALIQDVLDRIIRFVADNDRQDGHTPWEKMRRPGLSAFLTVSLDCHKAAVSHLYSGRISTDRPRELFDRLSDTPVIEGIPPKSDNVKRIKSLALEYPDANRIIDYTDLLSGKFEQGKSTEMAWKLIDIKWGQHGRQREDRQQAIYQIFEEELERVYGSVAGGNLWERAKRSVGGGATGTKRADLVDIASILRLDSLALGRDTVYLEAVMSGRLNDAASTRRNLIAYKGRRFAVQVGVKHLCQRTTGGVLRVDADYIHRSEDGDYSLNVHITDNKFPPPATWNRHATWS